MTALAIRPAPDVGALVDLLPEGRSGNVSVEHFTVTPEDERRNIRGLIHHSEHVPAGRYVRLMRHGGVWMSDTPMERNSNWSVIRYAHGHVLIGGLGLGMIVHPIAAKPDVESVTVLEIDPDVVALVRASVERSPKVRVVLADVFAWTPPAGTKYQTLYFDIWRDICTDNLDDMAKLNRRYARFFDKGHPKAWCDSWQRDLLLYRRRQERRAGW